MTLTDLMTADLSVLFAEGDGAKRIEYRRPDGTRVTVTANVWDMLTETQDQRGIQTIVATRMVTLQLADITSVNLLGTLWIDGQEWAIARIDGQDDYVVTVVAQRHGLHEHARPGYRRQ